ncbi:hypothetical protein HK405_000503, partial [Cladochytrium tenue]
ATLVAQNPFGADVSITHVQATLTYNGEEIGDCDQDVSGYTIPAHGQATSPEVTLSVILNLAAIELFIGELEKGTVKVDASAVLTIDFGGYSMVVDYAQNDVPASLIL